MENTESTNSYEKLIQQDEKFLVEKEILLNLLNHNNIESKDSYKELNKLGGLEGLLDRLEVNTATGICEEEEDQERFFQRKRQFGVNNPVPPQTRSFLKCLLDVFNDKIIIFLIFTATIRLAIDLIQQRERWFNYSSIYIIVIIISVVVAITNYSRDQVFANFQLKIEDKEVRILRNKIEKLIPKNEIVVGDVLIVSAGDILPVDGIIFKAYSISLEIDKKILKFHNICYIENKGNTKKSRHHSQQTKNDSYPFVLSGSKVMKGYAYLLVLAVGDDTYVNKRYIENMKNHTNLTKLPGKKVNGSIDQSTTLESNLTEEIKHNPNSRLDMQINNKEESANKLEFNDEIMNNPDYPAKRSSFKPKEIQKIKISDDNYGEVEREILKNNEQDRNKKEINNSDSEFSPLQNKLREISLILSKLGIAASLATTIFMIVSYFLNPDNFARKADIISVIFDAILYGLVIIVVAVPEGLPLAVTLSLAFSLNKMREEKTVIKSIEACENMACVDTICTDYRGILTQSQMEIISIFIEDQSINEQNVGSLKYYASEDLYNFFCESISVNTIAFSVKNRETGKEEYIGDPIECSLIRFLGCKLHVNYSFIRNNSLRPIIDISPITSDIKCSFTAIEMDEKSDYVRLYVKGSPDFILDLISVYIGSEQNLEQMTPVQYEKIRKKSNNLIKDGIIPIIICYRDVPKDHYYQTRQAYYNKEAEFMTNIVRQLTFISLIGLRENLKESVEEDILNCQNAGIVVRMVTSQSKESARIAAIKCGIIKQTMEFSKRNSTSSNIVHAYDEEGKACKEIPNSSKNLPCKTDSLLSLNSRGNLFEIIDTQEDFKRFVDIHYNKKNFASFKSFEFSIMDYTKFNSIIENARVISSALSKDKFIFVATLKKKGSIVAITGDGVNDSLAMKTAHVGISMGCHSSDISKEAADVILLEDDFKSIITGIKYSRNIFDSVRKFLQFQITATASISILVVISSLPMNNFYLYPNQLLWLNLIMDTFGSISLASQQPDSEIPLKKKIYSLEQNIITKSMKYKIIVQTIFQLSILFFVMFIVPLLFSIPTDIGLSFENNQVRYGYHTTLIFTCIIFMQVFNAFISRSIDKDDLNILRNIHKHHFFVIIQIGIVLLQYVIVNNGHSILKTIPLSMNEFLMCFGISSITLLTLPIVKYMTFKDDMNEDLNSKRVEGEDKVQ